MNLLWIEVARSYVVLKKELKILESGIDLFLLACRCHEAEQSVDERDRHPTNSREKHMLYPVSYPNKIHSE